MNIRLQRVLDRVAGVPLCAVLSLWLRLRRALVPAGMGEPPKQRILIVLLSEMGSLVLAQPMFAALKKRHPDAELFMLMFEKNREVLDLLGVMPPQNVITLNDQTLARFVRDSLRALRRLRALKLDAVIDCELFSRVSAIFSGLANARIHAGFHAHTQEGLYRGAFINRPVLYNPYRHLSQQLLTLADAIELAPTGRGRPLVKAMPHVLDAVPPVQFAAGEVAAAAAQVERDYPQLAGKKWVLVYPDGGVLPIRAWPAAHYKKLCAALLQEGYAVALIGLPQAAALAADIAAHCNHELCVNLAGYTRSVRHLLALFQRASLLVTNDGGPGQFAALTSLPTLVLFGPETPALYSPLAANIHCLYLGLACSPCLTAYNHRNSPCDGDNQCLRQITPEQVIARAHELLQANGA